jgi:hypothetical protein
MKPYQTECATQIAWLALLTILSFWLLGSPPAAAVFIVGFCHIYQTLADR